MIDNNRKTLLSDENILNKLSLIFNIIIVIIKVLLIIYLIFEKEKIFQSSSNSSDSETNGFYVGAILSFVVAAIYLLIIICLFKLIFSAITIFVGIKNKFNITYSTFSVVSTVFLFLEGLGLIGAIVDGITKKQFDYTMLAVEIPFLVFIVFNAIVQLCLYKLKLRKTELEEIE